MIHLWHDSEEPRVRRQLLFPFDDNYFSRSATTTSFCKANFSSILVLAGAEDKALQGCTLSADSGARPERGGHCSAPPVNGSDLGWQESDQIPEVWRQSL